ncbi:MAG: ArgE/DapE family deacylase, partial [Thaumarchaeota archaeon]|nr:ArgE/DapE family deacylase [Nitrososphaerota archaeon]
KIDLFEKARGRKNLVGSLDGKGNGRSLMLTGHMDTVPFGKLDKWEDKDPLSGEVRDGKLYGRGSCDMKSGIACMSKAVEAIQKSGMNLQGKIIFASVVGEETFDHALGTSAVIERGYKAHAAILTEPTSLNVQPVSTGVLLLRISIEGKTTHATARDLMIRAGGLGDEIGVNAIEKGVKVIELLQDLEEQWGITKRHPLFAPGHFTIHPGVIDGAPHGHRYVAVVPDYCTIDYAIMWNPSESQEAIQNEIEDYVMKGSQLDTWLSKHPPQFEWIGFWPAGEISPEHPICRSLSRGYEKVLNSKPKINGFPAPVDAPFLDQAGIPTVIFGPGNLPQAHAENEYIEVEQLIRATKILALSVMDWCGIEPA